MNRWRSAFLWTGLGVVAVTGALLAAIFRSTSSTAGLGILVITFQVALLAPPFFVFGYCLPDLVRWFKGKSAGLSISAKLRAVIAAILATCGISYIVYGVILTVAVNDVRTMNEPGLDKFLEGSMFRNNKFALGALAQNLNVSAAVLDRIARMPEPELNDRMSSVWPVMAGNGKGLSVMRLVVRNPNVSASTIEYLASTSQTDYVLGDIAGNPKTSIETLSRLETKKNYLIDWGLAQNPKTPPGVFSKLLDREKYFTQKTTLEMLLKNPSTPSEIRTKASELLKDY